jgi:hypothetical protein
MGVSRYRARSLSFVREIGKVGRDSSRVSGRVDASAFVASAGAVRAASGEGSHRGHSESSGRGCKAAALASRRAIGGTACSARWGFAGTGSGVEVRSTAPGRSRARQAAGTGERRAGRPGARQGSVGGLDSRTWRCLATSGSRWSSRAETSATWSWMPKVIHSPDTPRLVRARPYCSARDSVRTSLLLRDGASTAPRPRSRPRSAKWMRASPEGEVSSATWRTRRGSRARPRVASTTRGTGRWVRSRRHEPSGSRAGRRMSLMSMRP